MCRLHKLRNDVDYKPNGKPTKRNQEDRASKLSIGANPFSGVLTECVTGHIVTQCKPFNNKKGQDPGGPQQTVNQDSG